MQLLDGLLQGIEKLNFIFCESRFLLVKIVDDCFENQFSL